LILGDDSEFWQSCANYCTVMKAVVDALKEFDGKQPCMGNIYMIMRALCHHVAALHNAPFNLYFHTMSSYCREHVWSSMGVKEVPHLWWFTSGSIGKSLPRIARRILA
jgi:hypothetical protein